MDHVELALAHVDFGVDNLEVTYLTIEVSMKICDLNRAAWNQAVDEGENPYTQVVSPEGIAEARQGTWSLYLSDTVGVK